jgi:hypothetical protein
MARRAASPRATQNAVVKGRKAGMARRFTRFQVSGIRFQKLA